MRHTSLQNSTLRRTGSKYRAMQWCVVGLVLSWWQLIVLCRCIYYIYIYIYCVLIPRRCLNQEINCRVISSFWAHFVSQKTKVATVFWKLRFWPRPRHHLTSQFWCTMINRNLLTWFDTIIDLIWGQDTTYNLSKYDIDINFDWRWCSLNISSLIAS